VPVSIKGTGGGSVTLSAAAAATDTTLTLPNTTGTVALTASQTFTGTTTFPGSTVVDSSGNVGIGTSSPSTPLTVKSRASDNVGVRVLASPSNVGGIIQFTDDPVTVEYGSIIGAPTYMLVSSTTNLQIKTNGSEAMRIDTSGNVGIGTSSPNASAILDAQSTTKGVRFPNMTTTQKNAVSSPAAGLVVFDTTLAKLCVYSGSAWQTITSL